tara:strand:- start:1942 stop:4050 length:2109 start_codon:yes stop_codon:yes gene_type:complete
MKKRKYMNDTKLKNFNPMALREKYSAQSRVTNYSSFWNDNDISRTSIFDDEETKKGNDLVALASYRRAISNFVSIVTGESDIKVTFTANGDSYTDGKAVTISSKLDDKLFDSTVGLALHEGSHIKLSDFDFLKQLENNIPEEYYRRAELFGIQRFESTDKIKNLLNYVEDRRIDYFIFSNSPGYKGYYHSMYDKYFHSKIIDKALATDEYTDKDWDSYIFRIINLTNKNSNLDALPGLREIHSLIFKNVKTLASTEDAFDVALKIFHILLDNFEAQATNQSDESKDGKSEDSENIEGGEGSAGGDGKEGSEEISDEEFNQALENGVGSGGGDDSKSKVELSDAQKKQLQNAIKKQDKFMNGDIQKKKLSKKDKTQLDTVESSGMSYIDVAGVTDNYTGKKAPTKVLMVKKFTKALAESDTIRMVSKPGYTWSIPQAYKDAINKGLVMGTILGKKLQVRGESRETKWSRLDSGRIDKRLIAELGFGNERVFNTSFVESYSDAFLHISVDASGSMGGEKWVNTQTSVAAIAKACSMINNVDLVISYRSTQDSQNGRGRGSNNPLMLIAYDSRVDKISKVRDLFPLLHPSGTTPEGLCFEAVMKEIEVGSNDKDSYFLNFSDGMPMFSNDDIDYNYDTAINHTAKMVKEIRNRGVKVLSYFIGDSWDRDRSNKTFTKMYGKDAAFVDVTSVLAVAKTMNKLFLEK